MYKNYLTIAIRILLRDKLFSLINIGGLTIGLTAAFIIILFVIVSEIALLVLMLKMATHMDTILKVFLGAQ